jgi:biotin operon repressor
VAVLSMSDGELRRLEVLRDVDRGGLPVRAVAQILGLSERQVWRLLKAFRRDGAAGLISKKRGRPSNRKTAPVGRCATPGLRARPPPDPSKLTFLNWGIH